VPVAMVQVLLKLLLKQRILPVLHDLHWLLIAAKGSESEILERSESESDILPPTPQPCCQELISLADSNNWCIGHVIRRCKKSAFLFLIFKYMYICFQTLSLTNIVPAKIFTCIHCKAYLHQWSFAGTEVR